MRVVVFGGRDFDHRRWLFQVMDAVHVGKAITCAIEGEMSGADLLARAWAEDRSVSVDPYPADWDNITRLGAVVKRNRRGSGSGTRSRTRSSRPYQSRIACWRTCELGRQGHRRQPLRRMARQAGHERQDRDGERRRAG
jgi:hypothetical protein